MDAETSIAIAVVAIPGIVATGWKLIEWSFSRNLKHEEDAKKQLADNDAKAATELEELEAELLKAREGFSRELQEMRSLFTEAAHTAAMKAHDASTQLAQLAGSLGELKGALQGVRQSFEEGREKQAEFYRGELMKMQQDFRQELSRHLHPDLPERMSKLEARLEAKRPRSKG